MAIYTEGLDPIADPFNPNTTLTMPHQHLVLTAHFLLPKIFRSIISGIDVTEMAAYRETYYDKKAVISFNHHDYINSGVYFYNRKSIDYKWEKIFDHPAAQIIVNPKSREILIRITKDGHTGIYRLTPPSNKGSWEQISAVHSNCITLARTDHTSEKSVIASFTGIGLYIYNSEI